MLRFTPPSLTLSLSFFINREEYTFDFTDLSSVPIAILQDRGRSRSMERPSKRARSASRSGHDRSQSVGPNGRSLSRPSRLEQALPTAEVCWHCY